MSNVRTKSELKRTSQTSSAFLEGNRPTALQTSSSFADHAYRRRIDPSDQLDVLATVSGESDPRNDITGKVQSGHEAMGQRSERSPPLCSSNCRRQDSLNRRWAHAMTPTGWGATMPARLRSKPGRRRTGANAAGTVPGLAALDRQVRVCVCLAV